MKVLAEDVYKYLDVYGVYGVTLMTGSRGWCSDCNVETLYGPGWVAFVRDDMLEVGDTLIPSLGMDYELRGLNLWKQQSGRIQDSY